MLMFWERAARSDELLGSGNLRHTGRYLCDQPNRSIHFWHFADILRGDCAPVWKRFWQQLFPPAPLSTNAAIEAKDHNLD